MKKLKVVSSGLPILFNIELRKWWERDKDIMCEASKKLGELESIQIPYEIYALSLCYSETIFSVEMPTFKLLKSNLSKKSNWDREIDKYLRRHIKETERIYEEVEKEWKRKTKPIKRTVEEKANTYLRELLNLFKFDSLPIRRINLIPVSFILPYFNIYRLFPQGIYKDEFDVLKSFLENKYDQLKANPICPPCYENEMIYIPLHESGSFIGNPLILEQILLHEIMHAFICEIYLYGYMAPPDKSIDLRRGFFTSDEAEVIGDIIAMKILEKYIKLNEDGIRFLRSLKWENIIRYTQKLRNICLKYDNMHAQYDFAKRLPKKELEKLFKKMGCGESKGLKKAEMLSLISDKILEEDDKIDKELEELSKELKKEMKLPKAIKIFYKLLHEVFDYSEKAEYYKSLFNEIEL